MSTQFLTDKSLALEASFYGYALDGAPKFAEPGIDPHYAPDIGFSLVHIALDLTIDPNAQTLQGKAILDIQPLAIGHEDYV